MLFYIFSILFLKEKIVKHVNLKYFFKKSLIRILNLQSTIFFLYCLSLLIFLLKFFYKRHVLHSISTLAISTAQEAPELGIHNKLDTIKHPDERKRNSPF